MSRLSEPVRPDDHVLGNPEALHVLVEYGDYECPFCGAAQVELERLRRTAGERFGLVFRNFPLTRTHPHALQAAEAAEAAGAQGRFWEMHDLLYENQASLELPALVAFARLLMLDVPRFERDLLEHRFIPQIRRDIASGFRSGVNGTPTFFIDGVRHDGPWSAQGLLQGMLAREAA